MIKRTVLSCCRSVNSCRSLQTTPRISTCTHSSIRQYSAFEPDGLDDGPEIPEYETLNVSMRGYDYAVLESFAKYVHQLAKKTFSIETSSWAVPARSSSIKTFKPNSTVVDTTYDLAMCERVVQLEDVPSTKLPTFIEVIQTHLPQGIQFKVQEPSPEEEEFRYIPDVAMLELQQQLGAMISEREMKKKK